MRCQLREVLVDLHPTHVMKQDDQRGGPQRAAQGGHQGNLEPALGCQQCRWNNDRGDGIGCSQGADQCQESTRQKKRMPLGRVAQQTSESILDFQVMKLPLDSPAVGLCSYQPDSWYSDPRLKSIGSFGRAPECQRSDEEFQ